MKRVLVVVSLVLLASVLYGQNFYKVLRLPFNTNISNEMAPVFFKKGLIFGSDRKNDVVLVTVDQEGNYLYNLYFTEMKGSNNWTKPEIFSKNIMTKFNESSACFSHDRNTIIFTSTIRSEDGSGDTLKNGLFFSYKGDEDWSVPEPFPYNSDTYNVTSPFLSQDGVILFFSSDNPEGFGSYDIYYSAKTGHTWSRPVNIGPKINTSESEVFPFLYNDSRLYFASRGHDIRADLDIFYSDYRNDEWQQAVKLPRPFNSRSDDFGFVVNAEMDTGYFASDRRGTDDIYRFVSAFPNFKECPEQIEETEFCYEFYEAGSMDLDATSMKYEWDLGDGTKIRGIQVDHCFKEAGNYLVQLNVIDSLTGEVYFSEASYELNVEKAEQPYINAPDSSEINARIFFDASESNIKDFTIENYYWDFGDGGVDNDVRTDHLYSKRGSYIIRLGVTGYSQEGGKELRKSCVSRKIVIRTRK